MKTIQSTVLVLFMAVSSFTYAQTNTSSENEKPYIEVTGTAEKEIIPDEIYISITIRERQEGKDKITIEKQEEDLKNALKSIGISLENLSLSDANADFVRIKRSKNEVITINEYLLKVGDAVTVGKVFEKLDELKIKSAYIARVDHSKLVEFKKEVRILAIKAAKEKADYLLNAINEQTGKPLVVKENNYSSYPHIAANLNQVTISNYSSNSTSLDDNYEPNIQFQKIKLQFSVYVKFEIK